MIHKGKDKQLRILNLVIYLEILTVQSLPLNKGNMSPAISFETLETHTDWERREVKGVSSLVNNIYEMKTTGNKSVPVAGYLL